MKLKKTSGTCPFKFASSMQRGKVYHPSALFPSASLTDGISNLDIFCFPSCALAKVLQNGNWVCGLASECDTFTQEIRYEEGSE